MRALELLPREPDRDIEGQGIVLVAGNRYIPSAWVLLTLLRRHYQCRLPIELWYLGDDDFPPAVRAIFHEFDVEFIDARHALQGIRIQHLGGWELKSFAILHSRFAEVLYLDSDNLPLKDPTDLFSDAGYRLTGARFWPDIGPVNPYNPIWSIFGLPTPDGPEWESGQMVLDKRRCWRALQVTTYLNRHSDFYYQYMLGDKETFHLAWRLVRLPYAMTEYPAEPVRFPYDEDPALAPIRVIWQHDQNGARLFHHRTGAKWVAWGRNITCPNFEPEDACLAALAELRNRWDGYFLPPLPAGSDAASAIDFIEPRQFRYIRRGFETRQLELLPGGKIGQGVEKAECFWRLTGGEGDGQPTLTLSGREGDTCTVALEPDGIWRGRWLINEQTPVEFVPLTSSNTVQIQDSTPVARRPRLLFLSPVMPADGGNGLAMRAAQVLQQLTQTHAVSLLIVPLHPPGAARSLPGWLTDQCEDIRWIQAPVRPKEFNDLLSDQEHFQAWIDETGRAYAGEHFDVIHIFRLTMLGFALPYLDRPWHQTAEWRIDLDDIESRTHLRLARLYQSRGEPEGQRGAGQHAELSARRERFVLSRFDRVFVCSRVDRDFLEEQHPNRRAVIEVVPNRVRIPDGSPVAPVSEFAGHRDVQTILYVGTLGYLPNTDAAEWFCRDILPVIRELATTPFQFVIAGAGAPPEIEALRHIPEVQFIGEVLDLTPWYRKSDLVVVPLRAGGGTRIKILEALAQRKPVVSTTLGAEGLELTAGQHLLIADRAFHFAQQCLALLNDPARSSRIAEAGYDFVVERYQQPPARSSSEAPLTSKVH